MTNQREFKVGDVISLNDTEKLAMNYYNILNSKYCNIDKNIRFSKEFRKILTKTVKLKIVELPKVNQ